jgi:7,8-dihydropterin-6-yl-methyl-4-(beta-D-ribofuranosyl)aminobenzene 5'-phosphate synthase
MSKMWALVILIVALGTILGVTVFLRHGEGKKGQIVQAEENTSTTAVKNLSITVSYDNNPYKERLTTAWGFSCVIRKNPEVVVYLPKSFPKGFKGGVKEYGAKMIEVQRPLKICEGVYSTGELGTWIKEQSLIIHTEKELIVITGCAHPGIVKIVNKAKDLVKGDVLLVMGGFHLGGESKGEIENIVSSFRKLGVNYVGPCHCSGDAARQLFKEEYGENFINVGVGRVITIHDLK